MVTRTFQNQPPDAVRPLHRAWRGEAGAVLAELVVAMAILAVVVIPMAFAFEHEMKLCRRYYCDAVAMEIVDGEMEILAAGQWRAFQPGVHPYPVRVEAATNLPPGQFTLTVGEQSVRLEWRPAQKGRGRPIIREARIK
jgi:hypothetical protein